MSHVEAEQSKAESVDASEQPAQPQHFASFIHSCPLFYEEMKEKLDETLFSPTERRLSPIQFHQHNS